jgi:hypothetical protein
MRIRSFILLLFISSALHAQRIDKLSVDSLNLQRIKTNKTGMLTLGAWGTVNAVAGLASYIIADDKEWKAFHGMNAIWGATNALIAVGGYFGAKREEGLKMNCGQLLDRYESNKRLYLINGALDFAYIGSGLLLNAYADDMNNPQIWHGFGKSIAMQGLFLLIFDGTMYASHQRQNKNWYKLMQGLCFTGNGIGFRYVLCQ